MKFYDAAIPLGQIYKPLVTVFIPYYNDEKFLRTAIEAVLNNDYENFELVLLNHATTDSCREIAHSYDDCRIRHIDVEKNTGAGGGLLFEEMLKIARGKYIKPLCADDVLRKDGLKTLVDYMESNPQKDFAFGNVEYIDVDGKALNDNWFDTREHFSVDYDEVDLIRAYSRYQSILPWVGSIIKKDALTDVKLNKTFIMMFDMSLWLSLLCKGYKVAFIKDCVANYRIHSGQVSAVENADLSSTLCLFEFSLFWKGFLEINNIDLVKQVFPEDSLVDYLFDNADIPFVVSHALMDRIMPYPYIYLSEIMNDNAKRKHVEEVFGYGVKELRDDCRRHYRGKNVLDSGNCFKNFKRNLYSKNVKALRMRELYFLLARKLVEIITLKRFIRKKSKKYSL